jgi:hypothetical protein
MFNSQLDAHLDSFYSLDEENNSDKPDHALDETKPVAAKEERSFIIIHDDADLKPEDDLLNFNDVSPMKPQLRNFDGASSNKPSLDGIVKKMIWLLPVAIAAADSGRLGRILILATSFLLYLEWKNSFETSDEKEDDNDKKLSMTDIIENNNKNRSHECRLKLARLVGLVGAPPLEWRQTLPPDHLHHQEIVVVSENAVSSLLTMAQAHVQLLLTLDQAFHWIQVSASLHLGLGPRSQCVERVERSALAKEYRRDQQQQQQAANPREEPQSHVSKSILTLASVRKIVAQIMVDQAASLTFVLEQVAAASSEATDIELTGAVLSTTPVEMPEVVSLTWIKSSRSEIAALLSHVLDRLCTIPCLQVLTNASDSRRSQVVDESTRNVQQAKEYLVSMLLLNKNNASSKTTTIQEQPIIDPLVKPLLQYREQLDALQAAIWACQLSNNKSDGASQGSDRLEWWSRVRYLSATCQAIEQEIQDTFFHVDDDDSVIGEHGDEEATPSEVPLPESGRYEHDVPTSSNSTRVGGKPDKVKQTKTVVFRGEGVKSDRPRKAKQGSSSNSNGNVDPMMLKPRDTVAVRQLAMELQKRVKALAPPEEDDEPIQEDASAKAAREPVVPLFLGASGSLLSELKLSMPNVGESAAEWEIEG